MFIRSEDIMIKSQVEDTSFEKSSRFQIIDFHYT